MRNIYSIGLIIIAILSAPLSMSIPIVDLYRSSTYSNQVYDENYMGWNGSNDLLIPFTKYVLRDYRHVVIDMYWPLIYCNEGFSCISKDNVVVYGEIVGIKNITKVVNGRVVIIYEVGVLDVISKPSISIDEIKDKPCDYIVINNTRVCDVEYDIYLRNKTIELLNNITEGKIIEVRVFAWLSKSVLNENTSVISIKEVASPFPLLNVGNEYIMFIKVNPDSIELLYDHVFGLYAYIVVNGSVYSLNFIDYPVEQDPIKFFSDPRVTWHPYNYENLRQIALNNYGVYNLSINDFKNLLK